MVDGKYRINFPCRGSENYAGNTNPNPRPNLSGNPFLVAEPAEATKKDWERKAEKGAQIKVIG